jgi:hypothetical protein
MKKIFFVIIGLCFVNHAFAADGAAKSLSREELELRLLAAQVEKAQAEAKRARSEARAAAARVLETQAKKAQEERDRVIIFSDLSLSQSLSYPQF